jgi:hypothetical protein
MLRAKMSRVSVVLLMAVAIATMVTASAQADYLTGVSVIGQSNESAEVAANLVNDTGLTGGLLGISQTDGSMWLDCNPGNAAVTPQYVTFDLGASYDLTKLHVWNYNGTEVWFAYRGNDLPGGGWVELMSAGMKNVSIQTSPSVSSPIWTDHFVTLGRGLGLPTYAGADIALSADNVRAVRILASSTYADSNYWNGGVPYGSYFQMTGLGKVRFEGTAVATPEPSTIVLLGAGLLSLLCYAWRKRK